MKQKILTAGLYIAAFSIINQLISGIFQPEGFLSAIINIVFFVITVWIVVHFIKLHRKEGNGFISFGSSFKLSFLSLALGGFIGMMFFFVYNNFIDPGIIEKTVNESLESTYQGIQNMPEEDQKATLEWTEKVTRFIFSFPGALALFALFCIFYAILSLILAAILKQNPQ
jgi:hypothetical protein